jgi:rhodanese-related sulfurtransferase
MKKMIVTLLAAVTLLLAYTAPAEIPGAVTVDSRAAHQAFLKGTLFLDVRPERMIKEGGKIKGAVNLFVENMTKEGAASVVATPDTPVVIYCNGQGCSLSEEAIVKLVGWGYSQIYFYRDGYPAWTYFKLPVEK